MPVIHVNHSVNWASGVPNDKLQNIGGNFPNMIFDWLVAVVSANQTPGLKFPVN